MIFKTFNTAVGAYSLDAATTADSNTAVGYNTLTNTTTGHSNTAWGLQGLRDNTTGLKNLVSEALPNSNINTEVEILKSPSVLMPVFEFVKSNKKNKSNFTFDRWADNLEIKLIKRTSVLEINYLDKNKELIIPVLDKISKLYQEYSKNQKVSFFPALNW